MLSVERILPSGGQPIDLTTHRAKFGMLPPAGRTAEGSSLLDAVASVGLVGRGGAGFPTARKARALSRDGRPPVLLANGTEGEPPSSKDKVLLARNSHLVLDGATAAAMAVGARQAVLVAHPAVAPLVAAVLDERSRAGANGGVAVTVVPGEDRFVAGEASALVNFLETGRAVPKSPRGHLTERGLGGRPTLVLNVETLAQVGLIALRGERWFRQIGTATEPGSMLVTVAGAVRRPVVSEVPIGALLGDVVRLAEPWGIPSALLVGGLFGTFLDAASASAAPFSRAGLAPLGASPGAGTVVVLDRHSCGVVETARVARYFASQSAGQCGPCVYGLAAIASELEALCDGRDGGGAVRRIERWLGQVEGRGACHLPDGAAHLVRSGLTVFAPEFRLHSLGRCSLENPRFEVPVGWSPRWSGPSRSSWPSGPSWPSGSSWWSGSSGSDVPA